MRAWISGGSGFVGRHLVEAFDDVLAPSHAEVDVTDADAVRRSVDAFEPDVIVHAAILNDFSRLEREGWPAYVGATRNLVATGARVILVSTDWVFDGTGSSTEATPPNPINLYGMLKAASEQVVDTVARISAVQGASDAPRSQDAGFGYFVAALVRALRAGERFTVWEGPHINNLATPTLASDAARLIARIAEGGHRGVFHCCGGESVSRRELALRTVDAFGLDGDLLSFAPAPEQPWPVPYDTRLDATATAAALGVELPDLDDQLRRLENSLGLDPPIPAAPRRRGSPPDADRPRSKGVHPEDARPIDPCGAHDAEASTGHRRIQAQLHDLITMGRVGVDLYPEQIGVSLAEVRTFAKSLGGSATNVAVAAARLGHRAAVITKVGDDPFGPYIRGALQGFGVDDRFVGTHPTLRTPVVFCEIHPPDDFPLLFYREPQAPDMTLTAEDLDLDAVRAARVFWTTGTGLSAEPSRSATLAALEARKGGITIHDLDHRPMFWSDESEAGHWARAALKHATVAVGNRDEVAVAVRTRDPYAASAHLLDLGVELAVVKRGPEGVLARTRDELVEVEPVPVDVVCGLGAGDAFGGALVHGLLAGWPLERTIRLANAAGAYVAARLACADAMPSLEDIEPQEVRT